MTCGLVFRALEALCGPAGLRRGRPHHRQRRHAVHVAVVAVGGGRRYRGRAPVTHYGHGVLTGIKKILELFFDKTFKPIV